MSARTYAFPLGDISPAAERRALRDRDIDTLVRAYRRIPQILVSHYAAGFGLDRDDIAQEARIGIAAAVRRFDGRGHFSAFAYMCAERAVISACIAARRHKHAPLNDAHDLHGVHPDGAWSLADRLPAETPTPEQVCLARESLARVLAAVDRLSTLERIAVLCVAPGAGSVRGEKSYAEVGAAFAVTPKQIDNALQRARKKLKAAA